MDFQFYTKQLWSGTTGERVAVHVSIYPHLATLKFDVDMDSLPDFEYATGTFGYEAIANFHVENFKNN